MDNKTLRNMLKLAVNPHATVGQLQAGIDFIIADIEASNARMAANPPPPPPSREERLAQLRRAANANLSRLAKR